MWEFVLNNPAWVGVLASVIFGVFTIIVIVCQVRVMKAQVRVMVWQGRNSGRHEQIQNKLIQSQNRLFRLQTEHSWLQILNAERSEILELTHKLHLAAACLKNPPTSADESHWNEVQDTVDELNERLSTLDLAVYSGHYDQWFLSLSNYVDAILKAVISDPSVVLPAPETVQALQDAEKVHNPIGIILDLRSAIRMEFFEFKSKWDAETSETP